MSSFDKNMTYHSPFYEGVVYTPSYHPYQSSHTIGFTKNDPITKYYQQAQFSQHPSTLAQAL